MSLALAYLRQVITPLDFAISLPAKQTKDHFLLPVMIKSNNNNNNEGKSSSKKTFNMVYDIQTASFGVRRGREVQEGGGICIPMVDSC